MGVTPDEVRWVARLARLHLDADELESMTRDLNGILAYVERLGSDDDGERAGDAGVHPSGSPHVAGEGQGGGAGAALRADDPGADRLAERPETFAPEWARGFFTVPRLTSHGGAEPVRSEETPDDDTPPEEPGTP